MGDDDREIFEEALRSMSPQDVFRGKYGAADENPTSDEQPSDQESREELQRLREQREMENAFAGVEPIERGKIRAAPPRDDLTGAEAADLRAEFEAALEPPKPVPELTQQTLAARAGDDIHTLNLRAMPPDQALSKLGLFIDLAQKDGVELVRLRIGSNDELLRAVSSWFQTAGLSYVDEYETTQAHADAAIFARIRRADPS